MSCYIVHALGRRRLWRLLIVALLLAGAALGAMDRLVRVAQHNPAAHSPLNLNLYDSIDELTAWIAADWPGGAAIRVSYDLLPELPHRWWIGPWHTVDESYRLGMAFDYLLESYYGLQNSNQNPIGSAATADYIVTSAPGRARYALEGYAWRQFGALYALKPLLGK